MRYHLLVQGPDLDRDTIARARQGHAGAFRKLVETLSRLTFTIAWRMTNNAADAEDVTQEVFLRLHRNLEKYDPAQPFLPWFRTMATNACLNYIKAARSRRTASLDANEGMDVAGPAQDEPSGDFDAKLRQAVQELPEEYRMVVTYLYFHDLGVTEIAEAMQVPTGTVKTWLFRARDMLKQKLKPYVASHL
jgi:RNA polymerase sigma-70 factor (ECF subfamily)